MGGPRGERLRRGESGAGAMTSGELLLPLVPSLPLEVSLRVVLVSRLTGLLETDVPGELKGEREDPGENLSRRRSLSWKDVREDALETGERERRL